MTRSGEGTTGDSHGGYPRLVERVHDHLRRHLRPGAHALVVTRGDSRLLEVQGRDLQHFPQTRTGLYAGYHPADGNEAVEQLEDLRLKGAEYFVLPATASWWLDHYPELREYLAERCEQVVDDPDACGVYALEPAIATSLELGSQELDAARTLPQVSALINFLLPDSDGVLLVGRAAEAVDADDRPRWALEPPDGEVTPSADDVLRRIAEAHDGGARYLVLLKSDRPSEHVDERVRRSATKGLTVVCQQRLAEIYELRETTP